jgi:hypothetical protein
MTKIRNQVSVICKQIYEPREIEFGFKIKANVYKNKIDFRN